MTITPIGVSRVTVVIVNWNGRAHLDECLASLRAQQLRDPFEIVVVDNGSTDGSAALLARHQALPGPSLHVLANGTNRGFAAANNQGIAASASPFVALLNNDTAVEPGWLAALLTVMERDGSIGCCASKILAYQDHAIFDNVGHVVFADGLTRGRGRLQVDRGQYERPEEVFCISGCAALLRRRMLDDIGLFDEAFFAYCEDADLGFRAQLRGWRCVYVPAAVVYHKFSAASAPFSAFKALQVERNRAWLAVKNLPGPLLLASPLFTLLRYWWQAVGALTGRGASGRFVEDGVGSRGMLATLLLRAYWQALLGLPRVLRQRRAIQARRTASTREVWSWLRRSGVGAREIALLE
jgi:GT2 family glycosyltransferase